MSKVEARTIQVPQFYRPGKMRVIFLTFCHYLLNGILFFCFYGAFLENAPKKQNFPSPLTVLQCT